MIITIQLARKLLKSSNLLMLSSSWSISVVRYAPTGLSKSLGYVKSSEQSRQQTCLTLQDCVFSWAKLFCQWCQKKQGEALQQFQRAADHFACSPVYQILLLDMAAVLSQRILDTFEVCPCCWGTVNGHKTCSSCQLLGWLCCHMRHGERGLSSWKGLYKAADKSDC